MIKIPIDGNPATVGNGSTVGFKANNQQEVEAWHAAGLANGGTTCEDPPGIRHNGKLKIYLAYLRDPAGNKLCCAYLLPKVSENFGVTAQHDMALIVEQLCLLIIT